MIMAENRRHAAIMFTDIVGYTALMGADEDRAFDVLVRNREIHSNLIEKFNGTLIKEMGDGILVSFNLASNAVRCAVEIQKACKAQEIPLKIGIHEGEIVFEGADVLGDAVNIAARLESDTKEGCIYISGSVFRDIKNRTDLRTKFVKEKTFKHVDEPIKVYQVLCDNVTDQQSASKINLTTNKIYYLLAGLVVLVFIILIVWKFIPSKRPIELEKSIAVLPFKNLSNNPDDLYLADGMMDAILNHLQKIEDLSVRSRTSTEQYRDPNRDISEISKALKVNYILEGSFQKIGDKANLSVQLIKTETDVHIWAEAYTREWSTEYIFDVQKEIAERIAEELYANITKEAKARIELIPTRNLEAYKLYLRAKDYYYKGGETNLNTAIHFYQQAIDLDPQFALAYVWLGILYNNKSYWSTYFKETFADTLYYFANKALALNPNLENGYWLLSKYYTEKGEIDKSILQLKKAIELNPNYGDAFQMLGNNYTTLEQYIDAYVNFQKARQLQIGSENYVNLLNDIWLLYFYIGDYSKVELISEEIKGHNLMLGYKLLGFLYTFTGDYEKLQICADNVCAIDSGEICVNILTDLYTQTGNFIEAEKYRRVNWLYETKMGEFGIRELHRIAYIFWNLEKRDTAHFLFEKQIEYCNESIRLKRPYFYGGAFYDLAGIYSFLGRKEESYNILHRMEKERFRGAFVWFIQVDPLFERLWKDEEFEAIIKRQENHYTKVRAEIESVEKEVEL